MARLPDYTALGERPVPNATTAVAGYEARGTNVGGQISGAGREIEETAGIFMQMNEQQDKMTAQAAVNRLTASSIELQSGPSGFSSVKGGAAAKPEFVKDYEGKFTTLQNETRESLSNENQKRIFDQFAAPQGLHFKGAILGHQARETNAFNDQTENDTIDLARRSIFQSPGNPQAMQVGFAQINWAIEQKAKRQGWDAATTTDVKAKYAEKVYEDVVSMDVERNPAASLAAINKRMGIGGPAENSGNAAVDALGPDKLVSLRHRAQSYVSQAENKASAEEEKRLRIAEGAVKEARDLALTGVPFSADYERQLRAQTVGTPYAESADVLVKASLIGATFGSKTLPQQADVIRQMDAGVQTQGTDPEQAKVFAKVREINATQKAAYKDNPWAAGARFAGLPSVPEQQVTAQSLPQLIADRQGLFAGVETASGAPVSPLQPGEARAYAESLAALPPEKAAVHLGQAGSQLTLPRLEAFAEQVDKQNKPMGLALKLGSEVTTAGRPIGELVLRGAQAIKDKTVKKDDAVLTGWRTEIAGLVRGTLGDQKAEDDAIDAAYFIRAYMDVDQAASPGFSMKATAEQAVRFAIGAPLERNGVKTVLPRGMDETTFDAKLKTFTPQALTNISPTFFVRGAPISAERVSSSLDRMGMRRDGSGNFVPSSGGDFVTLDPEGRVPLRLPMR